MRVLILSTALFGCILAHPGFLHDGFVQNNAVPYYFQTYAAPAVLSTAPPAKTAPAAASAGPITSFHAQDDQGQYTYGYSGGPSAKAETKSANGVTRGSYSYIDANGIVQNVEYIADDVNGFRVAATNLPVAPESPYFISSGFPSGISSEGSSGPSSAGAPSAANSDTIEVSNDALSNTESFGVSSGQWLGDPIQVAPIPEPVKDTPEVEEAKAAHFKAVEEAKKYLAEVNAADGAAGVKNDGSSNAPSAPATAHLGVSAYINPSFYIAGTPGYYGTPGYTAGIAAPSASFSYGYSALAPVAYPASYGLYSYAPSYSSLVYGPSYSSYSAYGGAYPTALTFAGAGTVVPVDDPAVAKAKTDHAQAHQEAKARLAAAGGEV